MKNIVHGASGARYCSELEKGSTLEPLRFNIFKCNMFYFLQDFDFAIMRTNLHHIVWVKVPNLLSRIKNNHQQFSLNTITK